MAKVYLEKLNHLLSAFELDKALSVSLETKHFFSGAALYANNTICASWSPGGLAFKLSSSEVERLISSGKAKPLKYFEKGHIKVGYAMFENPENSANSRWKGYFEKAIRLVGTGDGGRGTGDGGRGTGKNRA